MSARADLHIHSTASDGCWTPSEIAQRVHAAGLVAFSLTDHDTLGGVEEAFKAGQRLALEVIPGVEISSEAAGRELHVLGYYIDLYDEEFHELLAKLRQARHTRMEAMIKRLHDLYRWKDVTLDRVIALATGAAPGRPHLARVLMERNYVSSLKDAFERFLSPGKPAYIPRYKLDPASTIAAISKAGGVPVLAHPGLMGIDSLISDLVLAGLKGIEVYHPEHSEDDIRRYLSMALHLRLVITGGSDCHGFQGADASFLQSMAVPYESVRELKAVAARQCSP